ncbi:MAG: NADPH-dependent FMN reductase [Alphaproteobacteria bacterium]|nr:NADPH-dependent FMN reductase [Alphaproteobacteria bacterium]
MTTIAIIYHSGYGHTEVLAHSVAEGVKAAGASAELHKIESATQDFTPILEAATRADGIIFGAPTYMGSLSAPFAAFKDATSKAWFTQAWKDKVGAGFTNSGNMSGDKLTSLFQLAILGAQHGLIWVSLGHNPEQGKAPGDPTAINRLGSCLGAMAQSDQASPEVTPPSGDHKTARLLGERVATITAKLKRA